MRTRSYLAIRREVNRIERAWSRERRRAARTPGLVTTRNEIRLEAARQALSWAVGDNAMSMSRIDTLNEREMQRRRRAARRMKAR